VVGVSGTLLAAGDAGFGDVMPHVSPAFIQHSSVRIDSNPIPRFCWPFPVPSVMLLLSDVVSSTRVYEHLL